MNPRWHRVATVPLNGGHKEAIVTIMPRCHPDIASVEVFLNGPMTPREARMLAATLVAAAKEAEES
jgi:hypothetical protein